MDLVLDLTIAQGLKSAAQIARRLSEDWATRNLYCMGCAAERLSAAKANTKVWDYCCLTCGATYQLKSKHGRFSQSVLGAQFDVMMNAIAAGRAPHYAFLQYSISTTKVTDLFVVPGHFMSPAVVEKRPPLKSDARRAGWVGSKILLGRLPNEARVNVVESGICRDPEDVRADWQRYQFLARRRGGWAADVLGCVRMLQREIQGQEFSLREFYERFEVELSSRHESNNNVQPKIRQQLQVLRDGGVVKFLGNGRYRIVA